MADPQSWREDVLYTVCHDLKNPLAIVIAQSQILFGALKEKGQATEARAAEIILRSAWRMSQMVDMLMDSVRLESGQAVAVKVPIDLCQAVRDFIEHQESLHPGRVCLATPCRPVWVRADRGWIERCLDNLVANALKYSPPESPVGVEVNRSGDCAIVSVTDKGPGIPPREAPLLFRKFYRAPSSSDTPGLGLGLYIARLIVEAHGGRIWVESLEGSGSTFSFSLPAC